MVIWYFPITEEENQHVFSINPSSIQRDRPILLIHVLRAKHRCFSKCQSQCCICILSQLWVRTEDISPDPLGPQDRLSEPPVVTDTCIEEKYNLTFHCYLENSCFQSTNRLPKQCKEIMVRSLCWIMHGFQLGKVLCVLF